MKINNHTQQGKGGDTHETSAMLGSSAKEFVQRREKLVKPAECIFLNFSEYKFKGEKTR